MSAPATSVHHPPTTRTLQAVAYRKDLVGSLSRLVRITGARRPSVHIQTERNALQLSLTDGTCWAQHEIPADVKSPGLGVVDIRRLLGLLRQMDSDTILVESTHTDTLKPGLCISFENSQYTLYGQEPETMPPSRSGDGVRCTVGALPLRRLLRRVIWAAHKDADAAYGRALLAAVHLKVRANRLLATATNGVSIAWGGIAAEAQTECSLTISSKSARELLGLLTSAGATEVLIEVDTERSKFEFGQFLLLVPHIEGKYPDVMSLCPKSYNTTTELGAGALRRVLLRATALGKAPNLAVQVHVKTQHTTCVVEAPGMGEAQERLEARTEGPDIMIKFNPELLLPALSVMDAPRCRLEFNEPRDPVRIVPIAEGEDYGAVVLPLITY